MTKPKPKARGNVRIHKGSIELSAYAGTNPATGAKQRIYDHLPLGAGEREIERKLTALVARGDDLADLRARRRKDPSAAVEIAPKTSGERTVGHALETWWKANGQHLAAAHTARQHIDIYLAALAPVALWRLRSALDEDEAQRDPDLVGIAEFYDGLLAAGAVGHPGRDGKQTGAGRSLAPATVRRIHATLHAALAYVATKGWLPAGNPAGGVRLPADEFDAVIPEPDEMDALMAFLVGASLETACVALLVGNGPRPQEVAALAWNEIDTELGRLALAGRGVAKVSQKPERWEIRSTPTDKRRRRELSLECELLRRYRARRDELALACGVAVLRRGHLFSEAPDCSTFLTPHSLGTNFTRWVARAREAKVDLPDGLTLYSCRHYGITHALRKGVGVAEVARRFGTSQRMIHQRYSHNVSGDDAAAAAIMGQVWTVPAAAAEGTVLPFPG